MRQLAYDEMKRIFTDWQKDDVVTVIRISGDKIFLCAYAITSENGINISRWADCEYGLDDSQYEDLMEDSISVLISKLQREKCFIAKTQNDFDTLYTAICHIVNYDDLVLLETTENEFSNIFDLLRDGMYFVHFARSWRSLQDTPCFPGFYQCMISVSKVGGESISISERYYDGENFQNSRCGVEPSKIIAWRESWLK